MKQKILLMVFLLGLWQGCSQKVKETYKTQETMSIQNPEINANNIVEELSKQVKHYPQEPIYLVSYGHSYCYFEVLINDIPVHKEFKRIGGSSAVEINHAIFKSGDQKITFCLYPVGKVEGIEKSLDVFDPEDEMTVKIEVYDNLTKEGKTLMTYSSTIPNPEKGGYPESIFAGTGKTYYEESFIFHAEVPYQLDGFEKAQDLRKRDPKQLEAQLVKEYERVKNIYQNKDYDNIAQTSYENLKNELIGFYYTTEDAKEIWGKWMNIFKLNSFQMQPMENYEMKFFADGKLVALMQKSTDSEVRGNTVLWGKFKSEDEEVPIFLNSYFYIPEGETEFRVY